MVIVSMIVFYVTRLSAEPIDSTVWALLKSKKCPLKFNVMYSSESMQPKNQGKSEGYKSAAINSESWTFPLIVASKITAFKEELNIYSDWYPGKTAKDLASAQSIFAGYGCSFGGNYDEHWKYDGNPQFDAEKAKLFAKLKSADVKNKLWDFMEPALKHQVTTMDIKNQGVIVNTFEYVRDYFGSSYDVDKAKEWYLKDTKTGEFARKDYLGKEHPARKITALIERCMFKHNIITLDEIRSWIEKIGKWLQKILGGNYLASKNYWSS